MILSAATLAQAQMPGSGAALPQRHVGAQPLVVIGSDADERTQLQRVVGATRLESGEIIVLDGASQELRVFGANGAFLRRIARRGPGPGELENATALFRVEDSLYVAERPPAQSRLHTFTASEGFRRRTVVRADSAPSGLGALARLSTGALVVVPAGFRRIVPPPSGKVVRDSTAVGILRLGEPGEVTWVGTWPGASWVSYALSSGPVRTGVARFAFGPSLVIGASTERVWIGDSGEGIIRIYDASGALQGMARMPAGRRAFVNAVLARVKARALSTATTIDERSRIMAQFASGVRPTWVPAFTQFVPGPTGEMWVVLFQEEAALGEQAVVFDARGSAVATATLPSDVRLLEVGRDYLLGVHTNADGVETVVMHSVRK